MNQVSKHFDVIIVGAGPAGVSCALALQNTNLNILLLDKHSFPRDKVCGDAIGGRSIKLLEKIAPDFVSELRSFGKKEFISTTRVFIDNYKPFNLYWKNESYCIKRVDFDALLLKHAVQSGKRLQFQDNFKVDTVIQEDANIIIANKSSNTYYSANMLIAADGSQSFLAKQLIDLKLDNHNFSAAVRAYYSNVGGLLPNQTEVHMYKNILPGYLWVFPLGHNLTNVGLGMLSDQVAKRKFDLKQSLKENLLHHPNLKDRFKDAQLESDVKGFGLALGSRKLTYYGNRFLLIGDAASLIDPKSGDGISNAIESGMIAATTIIHAHQQQDFSKNVLVKYQNDLTKKLGKELRNSTIILRVITYLPFLIPIVPFLMRSKWLTNIARRF